jgi:hypothetical protein
MRCSRRSPTRTGVGCSTCSTSGLEPSIVTFEIESYRDIVRLTVIHTRLRDADELRAIGEGWPTVFANLKTLLETGDVLPQAPWEFHVPSEQRSA